MFRALTIICIVLVATTTSAVAALTESEVLDKGRTHTDMFYKGELASIWEKFSAKMQGFVGDVEKFKLTAAQIQNQFGEEIALVDETVQIVGGAGVYTRTVRFAKMDEPFQVVWSFDEKWLVQGFGIQPVQKEAASEYLDYQTKTDLALPFEDEWFVFWGGRTLAENYHTATVDQRFAYDILIMKDGSTHSGDGKRNEDYHCFGRKVLAPGAGVVVSTANDVEDNVPGQMNPAQAVGNHVIIDHGNGEYSFLAHFKKGSVTVKEGVAVKMGQLLGLCGNSGNTTEAHIHYHLQTSPVFQQGKGLPAQFQSYVANGERVVRGEPTKGQTIKRSR